jgi:hypothetical protein
MKKKFKLVLSAVMLALALTFVSTGSITAYASADDPQGTVEKKSAPSTAPSIDWYTVLSMLYLFW